MRDSTRHPTTAATRRPGSPAGAVLVALALAVGAGRAAADDAPVFQPGAGLSADDHARIQASALFLNGFPAGDEVYSEAVIVSAGQDLRLWPANPPERRVTDPDAQAGVGAATLVGMGLPWGSEVHTELAYLSAGQDLRFWTFFDPNIVRRIPSWELEEVTDKTPIPKEPENRELDAYFDMIICANRTAPAALDKAALHEDGLWTKVFHDPEKYRGELLHFEGRLKRLRQFPAQAMAVQGGAKDYYEGYLSVDAWNDDPVFIICTELPPGLAPGESLDVPVGFSGYFYKIFRYTPADAKQTHKDRLAPLVIGRTLTLTGPAAPDKAEGGSEWPEWLGPVFFGVIGLTVALLFTLGYWFRGSDRHVHGRLHAVRYGEFVPPPPDAPPDPRRKTKESESPPERPDGAPKSEF